MINNKKPAVLVFGFDIYKPMYMRRRRRPLSHFLPRTLYFFSSEIITAGRAHISRKQPREGNLLNRVYTGWLASIRRWKQVFSDRRERRAYSIMKRWCLYLCVHKHTLYTHTVGEKTGFIHVFSFFRFLFIFLEISFNIFIFHVDPSLKKKQESYMCICRGSWGIGDSTPLPFTHPGAKTYRWRERAFNKQQNGENEDGGSRTGFHFISRLNR